MARGIGRRRAVQFPGGTAEAAGIEGSYQNFMVEQGRHSLTYQQSIHDQQILNDIRRCQKPIDLGTDQDPKNTAQQLVAVRHGQWVRTNPCIMVSRMISRDDHQPPVLRQLWAPGSSLSLLINGRGFVNPRLGDLGHDGTGKEARHVKAKSSSGESSLRRRRHGQFSFSFRGDRLEKIVFISTKGLLPLPPAVSGLTTRLPFRWRIIAMALPSPVDRGL